jgi:hypothetical protein
MGLISKIEKKYQIQADIECMDCKLKHLKGSLKRAAWEFKHINDVWPEGLVFTPTKVSCFVGQEIGNEEMLIYLDEDN